MVCTTCHRRFANEAYAGGHLIVPSDNMVEPSNTAEAGKVRARFGSPDSGARELVRRLVEDALSDESAS